MARRNYEKTIFLDFLTDAQIEQAQAIALAEDDDVSVTAALGKMVTEAIADKPEAAAALEAARNRAMDNFATLLATPLSDLSGDDGDDDDSGFDKLAGAA